MKDSQHDIQRGRLLDKYIKANNERFSTHLKTIGGGA